MTLDKRFKMWYHMTTNKAVGGHLMFKKVFILCLVCLLVVGGLCACQNAKSEFFGDKDQIYYASYREYAEGEWHAPFKAEIYVHNLGNLNDLPLGEYEVIRISILGGKITSVGATTLKVTADEKYGVFTKTDFYEREDIRELNENPPEHLEKLVKEFIKTH